MELPRSTWYYHKTRKISYDEKHEWLRPVLEQITRDHSGYGVPRIKLELEGE